MNGQGIQEDVRGHAMEGDIEVSSERVFLFHLDDGGSDETSINCYGHGNIDIFVVFDTSFNVGRIDDGMLEWVDGLR